MDTVADPEDKLFLHDSYLEWCAGEGIPIIEDFGVHLPAVECGRWDRWGTNGALVHLKGRGDWLSVIVVELEPGQKSAPQQHMFEEVVYVLSGHGSTQIETADGHKHSFEWGKGSLFALPLNAKYQHFNGSGQEPARMASTNNLPMVMNVFHNDKFVFDNPFRFPEREGSSDYYSGEGLFIPKRPGRHMWETNFVPDLASFELQKWNARGAGGSNIMFVLADGTMHAHMSEMPVGTYKKGHRHGADFHVMCVTGQGYSILWYDDDKEFTKVPWEHGTVFAPPDMMFHQHFNTSPHPARYLATACGGLRYPLMEEKRRIFMGMDVDIKKGGAQIEYEDQDKRVHQMFLDEIRKTGAPSKMADFIDESAYKV
jgi:quercetin dioxygenase-like cupin family protein